MTAYYNEIDPKAAAWLRELIKGGQIAAGDVDETDIRDVDPARLGRYTQCHFFAGIGGWSYALRLAGWPDDRPVWTGSCPCQPFSAAGRREGVADERHLWPHWHHLISVCRPSVVFGEQVASKDGLGWLDLVCADMEGSGYAVGAADLCAAGIGAPHIRQRLWFVGLADAVLAGRAAWRAVAGDGSPASGSGDSGLADAAGGGHQSRARFAGVCRENASESAAAEQRGAVCSTRGLADASGLGRGEVGIGDHRGHDGRQLDADVEDGGLADADDARSQGHGRSVGEHVPSGRAVEGRHGAEGGDDGRLADAEGEGRADGAQINGSSASVHGASGEIQRTGDRSASGFLQQPRPTDGHWRDADWLFCRDGKWRPVEPGTFPLAHGASDSLANVLSICKVAAERIADYAERSQTDTDEVLRMVRSAIHKSKGWEEQSVGVRGKLHAAKVLLDFMLSQTATCDRATNGGSLKKEGKATVAGAMQLMRVDGGFVQSSHRRKPDEQHGIEPPNSVLQLSLLLACDAQAFGEAVFDAHAALNRIGMLRGYGNAIVPQVAATFIGSVM